MPIATRGFQPVPKNCSFICFDRSKPNNLLRNDYWDVIYDQNCYLSEYLKGMQNIISNCGLYILTSSQAVYPSGELIEEELVNYDDIHLYKNKINDYGFEKLKAENIVFRSSKRCIFPRFPVVIGINDTRKRIQDLALKISTGSICLPITNPKLQIIDEIGAAKALFELSFKNFNGPINIAFEEIITAEEICLKIAEIMNVNLKIDKKENFSFSPFDLIKRETKTLSLKKQEYLDINAKDIFSIIKKIITNSER